MGLAQERSSVSGESRPTPLGGNTRLNLVQHKLKAAEHESWHEMARWWEEVATGEKTQKEKKIKDWKGHLRETGKLNPSGGCSWRRRYMVFLQSHQTSHLLGQGEVTGTPSLCTERRRLCPAKHKLVRVADSVRVAMLMATCWQQIVAAHSLRKCDPRKIMWQYGNFQRSYRPWAQVAVLSNGWEVIRKI